MASERPEAEARRETADNEEPAATGATPEQSATQAESGAPNGAREGEDGARESSPPPGSDRPSAPPGEAGQRRRFENILPGLIRRGIEKGIEAGLHTIERSVETAAGTTDAVRGVFSEVKLPRDVANAVGRALTEAKLPREIASAVFNQFDETKNDVLRIVAKEVRDFLEATDLASEIKAALTSLSFEIRTEVRFIPNDAGTGVKPEVRARSRVKRVEERERRRSGRRRADRAEPPAPEDDGEPS